MAILRSRRRFVGALLCLLAGGLAQPLRAQRGLEYEVKAAFLYNFIKFVEWPPEALPAGEPFRVCLLGDDPFAGGLERIVRGDAVDDRPITVERLALDAPAAGCHMLFVPNPHGNRVGPLAQALANAPVLLVGESPDFLRAGGLIAFVVDGGHVRFDINIPQAERRGLRISSKLLRVARNTGSQERLER